MSSYFPETELILNPDGSVYHLGIRPEHLAETVVVVGDPDRVEQVSRHFDLVHFRQQKREFVTHFGTYQGQPVTVISSGIGTDNVEILMHELDALANIDLVARKPKKSLKSLKIIRLGTSGSMQPHLSVDTLLASVSALGLDTLLHFYRFPHQGAFPDFTAKLQQDLGLPFQPYFAHSAPLLLQQFGKGIATGTTVTTPGFYAPQGRALRYGLAFPQLLQQLAAYPLPNQEFSNFEMETAGYYALGQLLGHKILSLNAIVANRTNGAFSETPQATVDRLIAHFFENL